MVRAVDPDVIKLGVGLAIFFWLFVDDGCDVDTTQAYEEKEGA